MEIQKSLLNADVQEYQQEMFEQAEWEHFCLHHPYLKLILEQKRRIWYNIRIYINRRFICRVLGHDVQSCTFFTECEGVERWWCNRCNAKGTNHLY